MPGIVKFSDFDPNGMFSDSILPHRFKKRVKETRFKQLWTLTVAQYAAMMREFVGPKRQRGSVSAFPYGTIQPPASGGGSVLLTNLTISFNSVHPTFARARFNNDGSIDENGTEVGDFAQVHSGEWWTNEPDGSIGDDYEVRLASVSVGVFDVVSAAVGTWITLDADRIYGEQRAGKEGPGTDTATGVIEIGLDGVESALDSMTLMCTAIST
jgi:hypothetical protein